MKHQKMINLQEKKILITGGHGFLGQHLVSALKKLNPSSLHSPSKKDCNLLFEEHCARVVQDVDIVIHAAAKVGGISDNRDYPADFFYQNSLMSIQMIHAAHKAKVEKFVHIGSVCEYPKDTSLIPYQESDIWQGYPEETSAPYGLAKKMALVQGQAYAEQFDMNIIHPLMVNMYGPNDHFGQTRSHVIAALIDRFWQAKQNNNREVICWGTGSPTREFLYVEDAIEGIIKATQKYDSPEPVNIGSGQEMSIKKLAETISKKIGYSGKIVWDATKPDGQPRRLFDSSRANKEFDFEATTTFEEGLEKTLAWYKENYIAHKSQQPSKVKI